MEVTINAIVETYSLGQLVAAAEPLINSACGCTADATYDLIMLFGPGGFAGTAYLPGTWSRYRGSATRHVSTMLHEIGHNIGLHHANELSDATSTDLIGECESALSL